MIDLEPDFLRGSQMRLMYFYFEPENLKALSKRGITDLPNAPRILFEDETLWHTATPWFGGGTKKGLSDGRIFSPMPR